MQNAGVKWAFFPCWRTRCSITLVYFMDATRRNGVRLCACGCFGRTLRLKVRVHGGVFVATNSQIASCESGMPFLNHCEPNLP